jgi:hypothetical protein
VGVAGFGRCKAPLGGTGARSEIDRRIGWRRVDLAKWRGQATSVTACKGPEWRSALHSLWRVRPPFRVTRLTKIGSRYCYPSRREEPARVSSQPRSEAARSMARRHCPIRRTASCRLLRHPGRGGPGSGRAAFNHTVPSPAVRQPPVRHARSYVHSECQFGWPGRWPYSVPLGNASLHPYSPHFALASIQPKLLPPEPLAGRRRGALPPLCLAL